MTTSISFRLLEIRRESAVEHIVLNRPRVRNAFNDELIAELTAWAETPQVIRRFDVPYLAALGRYFAPE